MNFRYAFFVLLIGVAVGVRSFNSHPTVTVESCYDGDTCTTTLGEKVRLACIDTPELRGPRKEPGPAMAARDYLRSLVSGKTVQIKRLSTDRYGRTVAELFRDGKNINEQMVTSGHADVYDRYAYQCNWTK